MGIEKARQKVKGNFYVGDMNDTEINDTCFDIITIIEALEHVDNPEDTLREAKDYLKMEEN